MTILKAVKFITLLGKDFTEIEFIFSDGNRLKFTSNTFSTDVDRFAYTYILKKWFDKRTACIWEDGNVGINIDKSLEREIPPILKMAEESQKQFEEFKKTICNTDTSQEGQ